MISCDTQTGLLDVEDALQNMQEFVRIKLKTEFVHIRQARNRVLSKVIASPIHVPIFDNSAMDGFAFYINANINTSRGQKFELVGQSLAGHPYLGEPLQPNQCVKIMTGAKIPEGANCVCMQENTSFAGGIVTVHTQCEKLQNIRNKGEDIRKDDVLFQIGHRLKSCDLAVLASIGLSKVEVFSPIVVALFSTGDELLDVNTNEITDLSNGQIFESNSYVLVSMLESFGATVINYGHISDDENSIKRTFLKATEQADVIITSGGVSVGQADFTRKVLDEIAVMHFWKLAIKPGKPFTFGKLEVKPNATPTWIFALPGNPVSATVTMHQLVLPILRQAQNEKESSIIQTAVTQSKIKKRPGRKDYQRGFAYSEDGVLKVRLISQQGSGLMFGLSQANCFVILDKVQSDVEIGSNVNIQWFDAYL
ncbi:gephyrin-like molybdotransferase Glp [Marinicellulosiphila megalodicopiae]|uniref:molybdopterin molybdotransferase MoeA n=1 Tax=Marinicellulosiphila megalodicopiae TaxID=2724896 RepID=UPI003BB1355C